MVFSLPNNSNQLGCSELKMFMIANRKERVPI